MLALSIKLVLTQEFGNIWTVINLYFLSQIITKLLYFFLLCTLIIMSAYKCDLSVNVRDSVFMIFIHNGINNIYIARSNSINLYNNFSISLRNHENERSW